MVALLIAGDRACLACGELPHVEIAAWMRLGQGTTLREGF